MTARIQRSADPRHRAPDGAMQGQQIVAIGPGSPHGQTGDQADRLVADRGNQLGRVLELFSGDDVGGATQKCRLQYESSCNKLDGHRTVRDQELGNDDVDGMRVETGSLAHELLEQMDLTDRAVPAVGPFRGRDVALEIACDSRAVSVQAPRVFGTELEKFFAAVGGPEDSTSGAEGGSSEQGQNGVFWVRTHRPSSSGRDPFRQTARSVRRWRH